MEERLQAILASYEGRRDELIPILQRIQEELGYLPEQAMLEVARRLRIPESAVWGVATFYAQFHLAPRGRTHVTVCRGTSCHVRGALEVQEAIQEQLAVQEGQTRPDGQYSLQAASCLGTCAGGPCIAIDQMVQGHLSPKTVAQRFAPHTQA
ncbi:MAG: NADH-quinone oxidoreductase subunit NuoE [Thermoguttaceae bacterium]